jgi:hypothetical protein
MKKKGDLHDLKTLLLIWITLTLLLQIMKF